MTVLDGTLVDEEVVAGLWSAAAASPEGIKIATNNPIALRQKLYVFRKAAQEAGDLRFDEFSIHLPPNDLRSLWIVRMA